ncbi:hypothetical protein N665_0658s0015 [Sinapis alba]|nr:hypothetical protein N665_0658s0015 [Sinapis alba]
MGLLEWVLRINSSTNVFQRGTNLGGQPISINIFRVIFNTLFGLSVNFWMAIITRFCLGCFNGLLVPIKRYPYFLPCLVISYFALLVLIISLCIPKWPLISSIFVYCIFSLHDMAYTEIFSLWANSLRKYGGLSYSTNDVGTVLAISGLGLFSFQVFVYPFAEGWLGPVLVIRISGLLYNSASILINVLIESAITGLLILQNKVVANGIAKTAMSLFKTVGPAGAGILFSWSKRRLNIPFLPGSHLVFFFLNVIVVVGVTLTFKPFLTTARR